ncbi:flagellar hook-basal body protein [Clostridiaceae bacterium M8S5]|nr:flagellar hook-basal body protein [Clostridiaceae bacterium M8S5]
MFRSMYISTTSLLQNQKILDVTSNNLANANTNGFKKDVVISEAFPELLLKKINDNVDMDNHERFTGVKFNQEDAICNAKINSGYFKVNTSAGNGYAREINFTVDEQGYLRTFSRNSKGTINTNGKSYILGRKGRLKVNRDNFTIDKFGNLFSDGQKIDNLITFPSYDVIGTTSGGVRFSNIATNFSQGELYPTGNKMDFGLKGEGFFKVQTPGGVKYTRDGSFSLNNRGEIITSEGYFVLGQYGSIIPEGDEFYINEAGEIIKDGQVIDKLDIVNVENKEQLRKCGDNLYEVAEGMEAKEIDFEGTVNRGFLEKSNINSIKEMINIINTMKNFETNQKVIRSLDEMLSKAANDIGRV